MSFHRQPVARFARRSTVVLVVSLITFINLCAFSQTAWQGANDADWNVATNWSTDVVPGNADENVVNNTVNGILKSAGTHVINSFMGSNVSANLELFGGTLAAGAPGTSALNTAGSILMNGGTLSGFTVSATGGIQNTGTATLDGSTYGALTFKAGTTYTGALGTTTDLFGSVVNQGAVQISGDGGNSTYVYIKGTASLSGGGTVTLTGSGSVIGPLAGFAPFSFTNTDNTIQGGGEIGGGLAVVNHGTIDANGAVPGQTILLDGAGASSTFTNTGLFEATGNGAMLIQDPTVNNAGGAITANGGSIEFYDAAIQGGTLNSLNGGTLFTPSQASVTLDGGAIHGPVTLSTGSTYTVYGGLDAYGTIVNQGNIVLSSGGMRIQVTSGQPYSVTLQGGGKLTLSMTGQYPPGITSGQPGLGTTLINADNTIQGVGEIGISGLNSLNLTNEAKGTVLANLSGQTLAFDGGGVINNAGALRSMNGATLSLTVPTGGLMQTGTIEADSGSYITINNSYTQTAGSTIADGTITVPNITLQGGVLNGSGTVVGNVTNGDAVNSATVHPGDTVGELTIQGAYTQGAAGHFSVEIGGHTAGVTYSRLIITGTASLNGVVDIQLVNGFVPSVGDTFDVMDFSLSTGRFAVINSVDPGYAFTAIYQPTDVLITVTASPVPGPESVVVLGMGALGLAARLRRRGVRRRALSVESDPFQH